MQTLAAKYRQVVPEHHVTSRSLYPTAARYVGRFSVCALAAYFLYKTIRYSELNPFLLVVLAGIGVLGVWYGTGKSRTYFTPLFFGAYYSLGFLGTLSLVISKLEEVKIDGHGGYGSFQFNNYHFEGFVIATISGALGLICGILLFQRFTLGQKIGPTMWSESAQSSRIITFWFIATILNILVLWSLGIGQAGLVAGTRLPRGIATAMVYTKNLLSPCIGLLFLEVALRESRIKRVGIILVALFIIGLIGTIGGLSRGYFVSTFGVAIIYAILRNWGAIRGSRRLVGYAIVGCMALPFVTYLVNEMRVAGYGQGSAKITNAVDIRGIATGFALDDALEQVLALATERIGGSRELMAAQSSGISNLYAPIALFIGDDDEIANLHIAVFGFLPNQDNTTAYGVEFGLFGMFALSGHYIVIFVGCLLGGLLVIYIESRFTERNLGSAALFFVVYFGSMVWGNAYFSIMYKSLLAVGVCLFVVSRFQMKMKYDVTKMEPRLLATQRH